MRVESPFALEITISNLSIILKLLLLLRKYYLINNAIFLSKFDVFCTYNKRWFKSNDNVTIRILKSAD